MATFGKTDTGDTQAACDDLVIASKYTLSEAGSISAITADVYAAQYTGGKCAIYDSSLNLVAESESWINLAAGGREWHEFTVDPPVELAAGDYFLALWGSLIGFSGYYDAGSTDQWGQDANSYDGWPDPITWDSNEDRALAIYATYTPTGGGLSIPVAMNQYGIHINKKIRGG